MKNKNTTLSEQLRNLMKNKKYHTAGTVPKYHAVGTFPKYHAVGTVPKYHAVGTVPKYHTVGTVLKSNEKQKISHCRNS